MTKRWRPQYECLREDCSGVIVPNKDLIGSWVCSACGLEILYSDDSKPVEYTGLVADKMVIQSASLKPYISRSPVKGTIAPGGNNSGKRKKKKPKLSLENRYRDIR